MPYFAWRGIHITGRICKGRMFARTSDELDVLLFKRDIALLHGVQTRSGFSLSRKLTTQHMIIFLKQLATLLSAGVLLPDALLIVAQQQEHQQLQEMVYAVADLVHKGVPFSEALQKMSDGFDPLIIQMVRVGQETGTLASSLSMVCDHLESMITFRKKVRAALLMPALTLAFFGIVSLIIFIVIIPTFASLFQSMHQELPAITRFMVHMSNALTSWRALIWVGIFFCIALLVRAYCMTDPGKRSIDGLFLRMPIVGSSIVQTTFFSVFHAVGMMLQGGMPLLAALGIAKQTVKNAKLNEYLTNIERDITAGSSLSQSMAQLADPIFGPDVIAMVRVGEESGCVDSMLARIALMYQDRMYRGLTLFSTVLQPMLMIILGLLITALIFAVYMPIFNLSQAIG